VGQANGLGNLEGAERRGGQSGGNRLAGVLFWRNDHCLELNFDIEWQCTSIGRGRGEDAVRKAMRTA
jgi:hypothetical protein